MSDRQEYYAATVEEAVDKASKALNVAPDQISFEVLDQGSSGFLGIGARDARIVVENVSARADAPYPEVDGAQPGFAAEDRTMRSGDASSGISRTLEEAMGIDATVDVYDSGDVIAVDIATQETGLLIGQKGETIDAIQYLLNVTMYKSWPFAKRIVVDSEGYRQRRVEAIQGMAHRTARRALREQRPLSLPPMSPAERRIVHLFLKENPQVTTSSQGEEENRRVVVSPV